jgi:Isochorismatase family
MNVEVPEYAVQDEVFVDPTRTALLVIDMQNDFVKPGGNLLVPEAQATVPAIKGLLDVARASRMRVVAASAGLRWYAVVIPRDAVSALEPFDLETSRPPSRSQGG